MGRKNKRLETKPDNKFDKFVKSFMAEQQIRQQQKDNAYTGTGRFVQHYINNTSSIVDETVIKKRNEERLEYAIQRLIAEDIKHRVMVKEDTLLYCFRKSDNYIIKYYASTGCIVGYRDFRGIDALIMLLKQEI